MKSIENWKRKVRNDEYREKVIDRIVTTTAILFIGLVTIGPAVYIYITR